MATEELTEKEIEDAYQAVMGRLDSGMRQIFLGHFLSMGDSLASAPNKTSTSLLFILWAYATAYGTTDSGQAELADQKVFEKACELINDLSLCLRAIEYTKSAKTVEEWKLFVQQPLMRLEKKYGQIAGVEISNDAAYLEQIIIQEVFKIFPKVVSHLTNLISISSRGPSIFNPGQVLRFQMPSAQTATR